MPLSLGTMIVFDRCRSPSRGLSIRVRREEDRGDVGDIADSDSEDEDEDEALDIEGDIEGRVGRSSDSVAIIGAGFGREDVTVKDDGKPGIGWWKVFDLRSSWSSGLLF